MAVACKSPCPGDCAPAPEGCTCSEREVLGLHAVPDCATATAGSTGDPALDALDQLCVALTDVQELIERMMRRTAWLREQRLAGATYQELVNEPEGPLVVELLTQALDQLACAGAGWRRAEAKALHDEGLSHERIAALFGVTRQRISALLANHDGKRHSQPTPHRRRPAVIPPQSSTSTG